jgi:hypothetical protein
MSVSVHSVIFQQRIFYFFCPALSVRTYVGTTILVLSKLQFPEKPFQQKVANNMVLAAHPSNLSDSLLASATNRAHRTAVSVVVKNEMLIVYYFMNP